MTVSFYAKWGSFNANGKIFDFSNGHQNDNIIFSTREEGLGTFKTIIFNGSVKEIKIYSEAVTGIYCYLLERSNRF